MSGLSLPKHLGPTDQQQENINRRWQTAETVKLRTLSYGLYEPGIPERPCPTVTPEDLRDLHGRGAETVALLLPWFRYYGRWLARLKGKLLENDNEKTDIATTIRRSERKENEQRDKAERLTADGLKDLIWENARHQQLQLLEQELLQEKAAVEADFEYVERALKTLTRQPDSRSDGPRWVPPASPQPAPPEATPVPAPPRKAKRDDTARGTWGTSHNKPRLRQRARQAHPLGQRT